MMNVRERLTRGAGMVCLLVLAVVLLSQSVCKNEGVIERKDLPLFYLCSNLISGPYLGICPVNDTVSLETGITAQYSLQELYHYLSPHNTTQPLEMLGSTLTFSQIHKMFPIEVTRSAGYSVLKVKDGGYYYIFWGNTLDPETFLPDQDPIMTFSAYIANPVDICAFDAITAEENTAQQVMAVDPFCELRLDISYAICSFSYWGQDELIMVTYEYKNTPENSLDGLDDLVVKEIAIVNKWSTPSHFNLIHDRDFPVGQENG